MSIHHEVSVHCDVCGYWEPGNIRTTRQRRRGGWTIWRQDDYGSFRHTCSLCTERTGRVKNENETLSQDEAVEIARQRYLNEPPPIYTALIARETLQ